MSLRPPVSDHDHIEGNFFAAIELVEYGDYQCPHCGHAYPIVKKLQETFGSKLKFIFRNFPLAKIHPEATIAAVATEAAARQEKFWEMHDIIFENQQDLSREALLKYAKQLGLDIEQFNYDLDDEMLYEKVDSDFETGIRSGVNATPTFFINGEKYNLGWEGNRLEQYIKSSVLGDQ
ncbi:DsbA family protein [Pinibacter aurantiacus]|uniref:DsbA family protein n=1 Tax=Pinibacter aurantiacus TaxID=2851599 RepID=A0A9E2SFE2_9BACT|nr:thioredoxin domain-containing protein [Pinibacter aurantiacus]MBV4359185.1 DsbA family protein [Pinibacter aurantiacus]